MNDWKAWLERGKKDMDRATEAFAKQDYEHAAYMTQQALEKHIKSVWIAGDMGQPKDLGHDIAGHIVKEIKEGFEKCEFESSSLSRDGMEKTMDEVDEIIKDMQSHYSTKVAIWKDSLGIEVTKVSKRFDEHAENAKERLKDFNGRNEIHIVRKKAESKASSYAESHISVQSVQIRTTAVMAIVSAMELIIRTFPHVTYGRYPIYVEDEKMDSAAIYAKQAPHLEKLSRRTDKECAYLSGVAENLAKARKK